MNYSDWNIPPEQPEIPRRLTEAGYTPLLAALLARRGLDRRRVMVDETAPLYHLAGGPDAAQAAQRFLFVLAERDIPGRAEQNALLRATMLALGYAPGQLAWRTMQGQAHVGYLGSEGYWQQVAEFLLGR